MKLCCPTNTGLDDFGHHYERFYALLVPVLRPGPGQAVCEPTGLGHPAMALLSLPVARLRQQLP